MHAQRNINRCSNTEHIVYSFAFENVIHMFNFKFYAMQSTVMIERQGGKRARTILRVFFLNEGVTISESVAADTLKAVINKIGIQKVADACSRDLDSVLNMNNVPLVTKFKDKYYANRQHEIGNGWFVFTGTSTQVKKRQLDMLKELFHLNMHVAIV